MSAETGTKRLGLLNELLPEATRFAMLINQADPNAERLIKELEVAASTIQRKIEFFNATNNNEIDDAFARISRYRPDALLVAPQGALNNRRVQIVTHATHRALPAIYSVRDYVEI